MQNEETERARRVFRKLKENLAVPQLSGIESDPFKVLIRTIISQSTAEINTRRAYQNLSARLSITPRALANADMEEIEEALKVAGLYRNRSKVIKKVSSLILEKFNGSLDFIYSLPLDESRKRLMSLPGVGSKTADIVLLFCGRRPVLPVDTHVDRVSKRLGLVPLEAGYEETRKSLQELYDPKEYFEVHMLFIALGRKYCRALKPLHAMCPVVRLCPSAKA